MTIQAGKKTLADVFNTKGRKLKIPFFQRNYVWKIENLERLIDDIVNYSKLERV